ncbi:hypothetical protein A1O7_05809 [Cladophialophora yegresii CBS 114405]|uniref:Heterokaryon incompatibility domain-containing protein n=1 Tax=Cladophialophora yegresii CBS 114405 TaxID=1182544 RepID=W9WIS1_9EURO|nr:uncharacterized protein A1O7_05809 [Cladophialophora yegresii CBS 114405]EXJ58384.1 hypothetical protein A1O7_05809 [Cladophialophora yegresii CBS 114405]
MDHILKMRHAVYPPVEVPYLCDDMPYSEPFETYPERLGFTITDIVNPRHCNKTATEIDKVLQAWLCFGLLETIFGPLFQRGRFIRQNPTGPSIISTERLRRITVDFFATRSDPWEPEWNKEWRSICRLLTQVKMVIVEREKNCKALGIPQSSTELLIVVLFQFLAKRLDRNEARNSNSLRTGLLETCMVGRGWCLKQVAYLTESLPVDCLYMISRVRRPDSQFQHSKACEVDCVVNKVDREAYRTTHVCQDSSCVNVTAQQAEILAILQAGHLPLVSNSDYTERSTIELLDSQRAVAYVAISHVWSHGLGNPKENSLPRCQLARLGSMVANLYPDGWGTVPYWIDTVCVPTHPPEARALAIMNLRRTYRQADIVLVVDAYLEQIDSSHLLVPEIALYITCSTWLTRLWTLQEGALARSLHFQFADRSIDIGQIETALRQDNYAEDFGGSLLAALINYRHANYGDMNIPAAGLIQFLHASGRNRSKSYATDEALCLATLAGLRMEDIARFAREEDRMYHFWQCLRPTPSMMAFWTGPRLKTPGRRWAPATLRGNLTLKLDQRKAAEEEQNEAGHIFTERGLMLHAPGLLIEQGTEQEARILVATSTGNVVFHVCRTSDAPEPSVLVSGTRQTKMEVPGSVRLALILKRGKRVGPAEYDEAAIDDHAVLVRIEEESPYHVLFAALVSNVSLDISEVAASGDLQTLRAPHTDPIRTTIMSPATDHGNLSVFVGTMLPDSQQWCLG